MCYVHACQYKTEQNGDWKWGFYINEKRILTRHGVILASGVCDIIDRCDKGSFTLPEDESKQVIINDLEPFIEHFRD